MKFKFNLARPTEDGWYLVETPEGFKPFDVVLFEDDKYYTLAERKVINFLEDISAWSKLEHPDSYEWLDLESLLIMCDIGNMTHLANKDPRQPK